MKPTKKFCDPADRYSEGMVISFAVRYTPQGTTHQVLITENWRIISKSLHPEDQTLANYVAAFESIA